MSTAALTVVPQWENKELLDTIKKTVCEKATDAQFRMFIEVCKATGLNPFLKEIWFVPGVGVMAGRDAYLKKANEHPQFDGMETRVERDERNIPVKAVCTVWRKDRGHPIIAEAYYNEYKKGGNVWNTYPSAMIAKVAEVLALKRSFAINGVVTEEEIGNAEERGSKEAQREYLASKGIGIDAATAGSRPVVSGTDGVEVRATSESVTPIVKSPSNTIEMRQTAKTAEAEAVLKDAERDASKKKGRSGAHGVVSLDKLELWKKMKADLRAHTGNDDLYKAILQSKANTEHANEIQTKEQATAAWNALKAELTRLGVEANKKKQDGQLAELLAHSSDVIGSRAFADLLGVHSCTSVTDVLALAADPLEWLLRDLKGLVDERQTK